MLELDKKLFDEYKRLDAICRDMFSSQRGVSEYIDRMDQTPPDKRAKVSSWAADYRTLKHLRWLRNQIAHEVNAPGCSMEDLRHLEAFHGRILRQQDPLALLRKAERTVRKHTPEPRTDAPREKRKAPCDWSGFLLGLLIALLLLLTAYIWFLNLK